MYYPVRLEELQQPAQYLGNEHGAISKADQQIELHVCLAFPDTYEVGMSHLGYQILYDIINRDPLMWAERVYLPLADMETALKESDTTLTSLEGKRPLPDFDVVGFSLQYELCMNGILSILDLGRVPLLSKERGEEDPLIIGGGPVASYPEPLADFFDLFLIGDGEELVPEFLSLINDLKKKGIHRTELLDKASTLEGVYVPTLFDVEYNRDNRFKAIKSKAPGYKVTRRILPSLAEAPFPSSPIVPNIKAVHDRLAVEVMRGCVRGCRFCQAGFIYRPARERDPHQLLEIIKLALSNTGYEELSLLSLSTADYQCLIPLLDSIKKDATLNEEVTLSLPSTRIDALSNELLTEMQSLRRGGFTIAPEAGSQRLRNVINKGLTEEQLYETCRSVFDLGWSRIKLYFMIGLPTETDEDLEAIIDLADQVKKLAGPGKEVVVSASTFVPKPHTPFQWSPQISREETLRKQAFLFQELKKRKIKFRFHDAFASFLEGIFARGDRKLSQVILKAYELGCRFDSWSEKLQPELWLQALQVLGTDPNDYLKERKLESCLPWEHIDCGISRSFLEKEWTKALTGELTSDCLRGNCSGCGICDQDRVKNVRFEFKQDASENKPARQTNQSSTRKETPPSQKIRFRFKKQGPARYLGHLTLSTVFSRAVRRLKLPICLSNGYTRRAKILFGSPLQVGIASNCELVDLILYDRVSPEVLLEKFNNELPTGLEILGCQEIPLKSPPIQAAVSSQTYVARLKADRGQKELGSKIDNWKTLSFQRIRKKKRTVSEIQLVDCVKHVALKDRSLEIEIAYFDRKPTLKPFEVLQALTGLGEEYFEVEKIGVEMR